jgi:hypothetical protein
VVPEEGLASDIVPPSASTRSPVGAGAAFVLAGPVVAVAVVAHDGGVRLICAGYVPHDDGSGVNGTALYSRASLMIPIRITVWLLGSWQGRSLTAPTPSSRGPAKSAVSAGYRRVASDQR